MDKADGATPSAARGTRALPKSNCIVPAESLANLKEVTSSLRGRDKLLWLRITEKTGRPPDTNDDKVALDALREIPALRRMSAFAWRCIHTPATTSSLSLIHI